MTKIVIKQTAAECHNLVIFLPLFVAHEIPESDPYWLCYTSFLNLIGRLYIGTITAYFTYHMWRN